MTNKALNLNSKRYIWLVVCLLLLCSIMLMSLCIGAKPLTIDTIFNVLIGTEKGLANTIIFEGRLPRTLNGL